MSMVRIIVSAVGDPVAFPELVGGYVAECIGFSILEKGSTRGKTSCAIVLKDKQDTPVMVEFTGDMFLTMAAALKGARQRFGDPWDGV